MCKKKRKKRGKIPRKVEPKKVKFSREFWIRARGFKLIRKWFSFPPLPLDLRIEVIIFSLVGSVVKCKHFSSKRFLEFWVDDFRERSGLKDCKVELEREVREFRIRGKKVVSGLQFWGFRKVKRWGLSGRERVKRYRDSFIRRGVIERDTRRGFGSFEYFWKKKDFFRKKWRDRAVKKQVAYLF